MGYELLLGTWGAESGYGPGIPKRYAARQIPTSSSSYVASRYLASLGTCTPQVLPWEQHPRTSGPSAASSPPGEEADPVPPASAKMASQNGARSPFFLFLRYEVEIPRQREVEIPPRMRRLWLRPHYEEVPAKLTFRAFSCPKWRGCSPFFSFWIHPSSLLI